MTSHKYYPDTPEQKERRRQKYLKRKAEKESMKTPDPIALLSETDKAYIAGLIDGEGCIRVGAVGTRRDNFYPIVNIAMTHFETIKWLQDKLSNGTTIKINNYTRISQNKNWKTQYAVIINGKRAQLLCNILLPFLITKKKQAEIISIFPCDDRRGRGVRLDPTIKETRGRLKKEIMKLNKRGPKE